MGNVRFRPDTRVYSEIRPGSGRNTVAQLLRAFALLLIGTIWCSEVPAQEYPTKPIKLIVTFSPGGFTDITARFVAQHWTERFGQPVVVENKPGAATVIGTDAVAKAAPDGYTLLYTGASTFTINPIVLKDLPYDPLKSFAPIGIVGTTPMMVLANPSVSARNIGELTVLISAKPREYSYGSFGTGTTSHFAGELLWSALGIKSPDHVHLLVSARFEEELQDAVPGEIAQAHGRHPRAGGRFDREIGDIRENKGRLAGPDRADLRGYFVLPLLVKAPMLRPGRGDVDP